MAEAVTVLIRNCLIYRTIPLTRPRQLFLHRLSHRTALNFAPLCCFLGQTNSHLDSHLPVFLPLQTLPFCILETSSLPLHIRTQLEGQHSFNRQHVGCYPPKQAADFPQAEFERCYHRRLQSQVAYRRCASPAFDGPQ